MGTVKPVPLLNLEDLKAKGHHHLLYVKPVQTSVDGMELIAAYRRKYPEVFEKFDEDIWSYVNSSENVQVTIHLNLCFHQFNAVFYRVNP
uniref:Uncharacterized protein n=1 Tax=Panagrolaimus sp. ES5 TaxID=591445 RepID=A0AC34GGP7_9BILA